MNRILPILGLVVAFAAGAYWYLGQKNEAATDTSEISTATQGTTEEVTEDEGADTTAVAPAGDIAPDMALGDADAPVTLIEYASYTCPHCGDFHDRIFKKLKVDYIDTGKVRFIHREVYFDRFGLWAGLIARCGGDMRYFGLVGEIYANQEAWIGSGENAEVLDNLRTIGKTAGMSGEQIETCLTDEAMAQKLVNAYETHATADDISGTPTMVINGEKHSNMTYSDLKDILDGLIAAAE